MPTKINFQFSCKICKHWTREVIPDPPAPDIKTPLGKCSMVAMINYYDNVDEALHDIQDGKIGGANVYTHGNFGCVNYEQKDIENEPRKVLP